MIERIEKKNKQIEYQFTAHIGFVDNDMVLFSQYNFAINIIIKFLKEESFGIDVVSHPVLYMMRHSLELGYKANFEYLKKYSNLETPPKVAKSHKLNILQSHLKEHFDKLSFTLNFDNKINDEFKKLFVSTGTLIKYLGSGEASAFRYTRDFNENSIFEKKEKRDIGNIKELYDNAVTMLSYTADLIAPYTDYYDLMNSQTDNN
ncbi:hypothetical protein [Arcicella aurantiaca]|uniref:hypothetical protein n=1 Tax=Arcicella aurantiaca TaxID=591202 RepID=UPI0011B22DE6|nr:hypothetical protein [Arcicella aurantiaca]